MSDVAPTVMVTCESLPRTKYSSSNEPETLPALADILYGPPSCKFNIAKVPSSLVVTD